VEHGERIVFLHAVKDGPANRSYGLQVAALAGVPDRVLVQGRDILRQLESSPTHALHLDVTTQQQIDMFEHKEECPLVDAFQGIEPDNLTPREALELLYKLKGIADEYPL
jgi:DNA mismatch repair protein MutS